MSEPTKPTPTPPLAGAAGSAMIVCPNCRRPAVVDHNSFRCDDCRQLWPLGAGHEVYVREVPCPDCYAGHFRPCQLCGDTGIALLSVPPNAEAHRSAPGGEVERNQEKQNE